MSTFHVKLRAFAECKREAVWDAAMHHYYSQSTDLQRNARRKARHARKESARHKRIVTRFGVRWAYWMQYVCIRRAGVDNATVDVVSSAD